MEHNARAREKPFSPAFRFQHIIKCFFVHARNNNGQLVTHARAPKQIHSCAHGVGGRQTKNKT